MQGVYRLADTITTVTTAQLLLYLAAPSTAVLEILSAKVTCQDEDTAEQINIKLARVASGTVAGGGALTPKPTELGSSASGATGKEGNTAITGLTMDSDSNALASGGANKLGAGWEYLPFPEERNIISPSDELVLEILDTIVSCDLTCEITYREIGT